MNKTIFFIIVILFQFLSAQDIEPKKLLIYYGWPSSINGTFNNTLAAAEFGQYDYIVLGDGLQSISHGDHSNTVAIITELHSSYSTLVFGYIDLGVSTQNLSLATISTIIDDWQTTGVDGIFFDDYGYDFQVSRDRQNVVVALVQAKGMPVIANGWDPDHVFSTTIDATHNPSGTGTLLGSNDYYLSESYQVTAGNFQSESTWRTKADKLKSYQDVLNFKVLSITTNDAVNVYTQDEFFYAWYSALLYGHEATGWGEYNFSSVSAQAPFRTRPTLDAGTLFYQGIVDNSPEHYRYTDIGKSWVKTDDHTFGFALGDTPLPVTLTTFTATTTKQGILLEWETASEQNNLGFILSRIENGEKKSIAGYKSHPGLKGHGNYSGRNTYQFIDENIEANKTYGYTLISMDFSGTVYEYPEIVVFYGNLVVENLELDQNYPNPFNPHTTIRYTLEEEGRVRLVVFDRTGRIVKTLINQNQTAGSKSVVFTAEELASGIYIYRLDALFEKEIVSKSRKLILIR